MQSSNALPLAATGNEHVTGQSDSGGAIFAALAAKSCESEAWGELMDKFGNLHHILHDTVICERDIEPVSVLVQDIRDAGEYMKECERLAAIEGQ